MSEWKKEIPEEEQEDQQEEMMVLDDASAEILMRQIADADTEYDRMESWYKTQLKRCKERRDGIVSWAKGCLRAYFDLVPKKETKTQSSYQTLSGKMVLKRLGPAFDVDDAVTVPWLKENGLGDYVKVKESVNWEALKKAVNITGAAVTTEDGEIIPGITVTEREPEFTVVIK